MPKAKVPGAKSRGCPAKCPHGGPQLQRPLSHEELISLPRDSQAHISAGGWPCYICDCCGALYVREPYLDVRIGRLKDFRNIPAPEQEGASEVARTWTARQ
jgi:hypothetical protein